MIFNDNRSDEEVEISFSSIIMQRSRPLPTQLNVVTRMLSAITLTRVAASMQFMSGQLIGSRRHIVDDSRHGDGDLYPSITDPIHITDEIAWLDREDTESSTY